jgi:hypothetical protein
MSRGVAQPTVVSGAGGLPVVVGAVPVVRPHLNPPSWSAVATQLKSLLSASPWLTAGLVTLGAASAALAFQLSLADRRRKLERKRVLRMVKSNFNHYRLDIVKYISEQSWNKFSVGELMQMQERFCSLLDDPRRGVIPISVLTTILRKAGVDDEHVAHACAKFFDLDGNYQVDFVELAERLNLLVHGSKHRKLQALFSVYDLDNSGRTSKQPHSHSPWCARSVEVLLSCAHTSFVSVRSVHVCSCSSSLPLLSFQASAVRSWSKCCARWATAIAR